MPPPFVARASRWRLLLLSAVGAAFVGACLWIVGLLGPAMPHPSFVVAAAWLVMLFFGSATLACLWQSFTAGDVITIDERGIIAHRYADDVIPWSEIRQAEVLALEHQSFIIIELRKPQRVRPTTLMGKFARANRGAGFGDLSLSTIGTDKDFDQLVEALRAHQPAPPRALASTCESPGGLLPDG